MCKQVSYSKYQKRIIKFLNDLLGSQTPFSYERTQNNHLKVLIEGVSKPLYTGSTPSDTRSINNFMAEVKKELRLADTEVIDDDSLLPNTGSQNEKMPISIKEVFKPSYDKLIQTCIKSLRTRVETIKAQEKQKVEESNDVDFIKSSRLAVVKHAISHVLQSNKQAGYIKPKTMREIESNILRHLNFMLPSIAFYSDLLAPSKQTEREKFEEPKSQLGSGNVVNLEKSKKAQLCQKKSTKNTVETMLTAQSEKPKSSGLSQQVMSLSTNKRIRELRSLTNGQALALIKDIEQAMTLNREQDIESVVSLIREKDLPLEAIIKRIEAA
ncbi:hypothetical protein [uncultured Shewanella sp.]|uniref:hypothetical protein n=1 Tax=uncultured Shewanella sp. TaxID=173975 RepID=UPI00262C956B|nr:hypothetical protein [uncultured Shewanella sp.]